MLQNTWCYRHNIWFHLTHTLQGWLIGTGALTWRGLIIDKFVFIMKCSGDYPIKIPYYCICIGLKNCRHQVVNSALSKPKTTLAHLRIYESLCQIGLMTANMYGLYHAISCSLCADFVGEYPAYTHTRRLWKRKKFMSSILLFSPFWYKRTVTILYVFLSNIYIWYINRGLEDSLWQCTVIWEKEWNAEPM